MEWRRNARGVGFSAQHVLRHRPKAEFQFEYYAPLDRRTLTWDNQPARPYRAEFQLLRGDGGADKTGAATARTVEIQ